jgi:hypothetical protein
MADTYTRLPGGIEAAARTGAARLALGARPARLAGAAGALPAPE